MSNSIPRSKSLDRGGFGEIYSCIRKKDKNAIAVKILEKKNISEKELQRALDERDFLKKLKHNNFITL